jgi:hypothetical protein
MQGGRLLLPALEVQYFFGGIQMLNSTNLDTFIKRIDSEIRELEHQVDAKHSETFYDDLCLARFLKGNLERELVFPTMQTLVDITVQVRHGRAFSATMDGEPVPETCTEYVPSEATVKGLRYSIMNLESVLKQSALIKVWLHYPNRCSTIIGYWRLQDTS